MKRSLVAGLPPVLISFFSEENVHRAEQYALQGGLRVRRALSYANARISPSETFAATAGQRWRIGTGLPFLFLILQPGKRAPLQKLKFTWSLEGKSHGSSIRKRRQNIGPTARTR